MQKQLIDLFREHLKDYVATPIRPEYQEHVDVLNSLIPAFVDAVTDEELERMIDLMCDYIMEQIITPLPPTESEQQKETE